jgi:hypothetical protein
MVKLRKPFLLAACFVLICGFFGFNVSADDWNKATLITVNQPIEVPGRVLPAGTYLFKLMDTIDRHVVQIMSEDQTTLYQTVLGIPDYRTDATDKAALTFYERPAGSVSSVRSWFYAGEKSGVEFVYQKERWDALAKGIGGSIPASETAVKEAAVTEEQPAAAAPQSEIAENPPESQIAQNTEPEAPAVNAAETAPPAPEEQQPAAAPDTLPKTASPDSLLLLIGLTSAFGAYGVRRLRS